MLLDVQTRIFFNDICLMFDLYVHRAIIVQIKNNGVNMAGGRPTKYDPSLCEKAFEVISEGASIPELAYIIKVDQTTINDWMRIHQDFALAIKSAREIAEGWWLMHGKDNLHNKEFNSTLWYMNMKNRYGWTDKKSSDDEKNSAVELLVQLLAKKSDETK